MKKIIFITRELVLGGAAFLTLRYIDRLLPHFEIDLLVTGPLDSQMKELVSSKVSVFHFSRFNPKEPIDGLEAFTMIQEVADLPPFQKFYDAVIGTSLFPSWEACLSYSLIKSQVKYSFLLDESLTQYTFFSNALKVSAELAIASTHTFLPVSRKLWQKVAASCPAIIGIPIYVAQPIVEVEKVNEIHIEVSKDLPMVLTVARLSAEKQLPESLYIHRNLLDQGIRFRWYIIGSGPQQEFIQSEIKRLKMEDYFILLGPMENAKVFAWMRYCDVFVLFSKSEGCPTVVMEALVMNRPVLATDVNGVDELIQDGLSGLIVKNDLEAMQAGLKKMVKDEGFRNQLIAHLVENPIEKVFAQNLEKFILELKSSTNTPIMSPKVTILIIAFNHETCISKAISSALMQDYSALEVVVLDDASSDGTDEQAKKWKAFPRFRYERNQTNLGRVKNYRKAITEVATSEWVLILDGDDYLVDPRFISRAMDFYQQMGDQSTVMIQAGHRVFFENESQKHIEILPGFPESAKLLPNGEYLKFVYDTGFFTHLGTLFKRQQAVNIGCYTAEISSTDMDGLLRLALEGNVLVLNQIAGNWVQHGKNASTQLDFKEIVDNVRLFRIIADLASQNKLISTKDIEPSLSAYQATTLASLFWITLSHKQIHPRFLIRMIQTTWQIRPQLLLNRKIARSLFWYMRKSFRYSFSQLMNLVGWKKKLN